MNLANLSIKRPIFITCIIIVMIVMGMISFKNLPVDQMPDVTFPTVNVTVNYRGAGPQEIETLITKPLEDQIGTISGLKRITSKSMDGISQVTAEFQLKVDIKTAEQQVRDKVTAAKANFPTDNNVSEPTIRRMDPSDSPIITLALQADLPEQQLYYLADQVIKMRLEQVENVGQVQIKGGRKREIQVQLDREKLRTRNFSVTQVSNQLQSAGENVPGGKVSHGDFETVFKSLGEFRSVQEVADTVVSLQSNEVPTRISDLGHVIDTMEDETTRVFVNGKKSLFLNVYKQSGSNTLSVVDGIKAEIAKLGTEIKDDQGHPSVTVVQDSSKSINENVEDVEETIVIGILLTVFVVFFFLGSWRSTIITGLALPNSLIGAFILMSYAGFTINVISLLALTLAVGLLIDDAIVVRENIFRHIEAGSDPLTAAKEGTKEVQLAVIATTAVVIAVFAPVGFMSGIIGQFLKQFGLTICFAMAISLFDALTIAPMLSAYLAEAHPGSREDTSLWGKIVNPMLRAFNRMQDWLENIYEKSLKITLRHPLKTLIGAFIVFVLCVSTVRFIPFNFIPDQDSGELTMDLDVKAGTNIEAMSRIAEHADNLIRAHKEVQLTTLTVGGSYDEPYKSSLYIKLKPKKERTTESAQLKDILRKEMLVDDLVKVANPQIKSYSSGGGGSGLTMNLVGSDQAKLEEYSTKLVEAIKKHSEFYDVDTSYRPGKPEFQLFVKKTAAPIYGINTKTVGNEIHAQVEGTTPAKFRENGWEYNVRVRLRPEQRDLQTNYDRIYVPNINGRLVKLSDIAENKTTASAASIDRLSRGHYIQITSEVKSTIGQNDALAIIERIVKDEVKLPSSIRIIFTGGTENFQEMQSAFTTAIGLAIMFIFLVLASLYESFVTPFTIMLALPLAICGAFVALLLAQEQLTLFSLLGIIMLLGVACKNSILLVDTTNQLMKKDLSLIDALIAAGKTRLRPILMTSIALIMGTIPVAIGLNEASKQRTSMGYAIIGGVISSTFLTMYVVPSAFIYIERFRLWSGKWLKKIFAP